MFLNMCYQLYENRKSESGVLDFEDILLKTKMLLDNEQCKKIIIC